MSTARGLLSRVYDRPYPLLFVTVSGAHLYGFPSPDSDYDLRGSHILPAREVLGLQPWAETIEVSERVGEVEADLVTHDARKFFSLLLKRNGYALEQVCSPLVVHTTPEHEELRAIAGGCVTRGHSQHYLGFSATQWRLFEKKPRVKLLLYVYRVLLTGIWLMRTGEVEANLPTLNEEFRLPQVAELIARKRAGSERSTLVGADTAFHAREYERLRRELEAASEASSLPEAAGHRAELNDLLVRLRLGHIRGSASE